MSGSVLYSCVWNCHRTFAIPQNLWKLGQAAFWYEEGKSKLVSRYDNCLSVQGDYVENRWRCAIKPAYSVSFLLSINIFVWRKVLYFPNDLRKAPQFAIRPARPQKNKQILTITFVFLTKEYGIFSSKYQILYWTAVCINKFRYLKLVVKVSV